MDLIIQSGRQPIPCCKENWGNGLERCLEFLFHRCTILTIQGSLPWWNNNQAEMGVKARSGLCRYLQGRVSQGGGSRKDKGPEAEAGMLGEEERKWEAFAALRESHLLTPPAKGSLPQGQKVRKSTTSSVGGSAKSRGKQMRSRWKIARILENLYPHPELFT